MIAGYALLASVTLQRAGELLWSWRNTHLLKARGGVEVGSGHYPLIILVHTAWLLGLWFLAKDRSLIIGWASLYILLQVGRLWVLATLGHRWTTRIVVLPEADLIRTGPYRFINHPNYVIVTAEIAVLPLAFGLVGYALLFSLLNAAVLTIRIRAESRALAEYSGPRTL